MKRRCQDWGATDRALTSDVAVTAQVKELYFSSHKDDEAIASALHTQGLKRGEVANWLQPKEEGDWIISHTKPLKHAVREIAPWLEARLVSEVIEQGAYELKPVGGKKLVQL